MRCAPRMRGWEGASPRRAPAYVPCLLEQARFMCWRTLCTVSRWRVLPGGRPPRGSLPGVGVRMLAAVSWPDGSLADQGPATHRAAVAGRRTVEPAVGISRGEQARGPCTVPINFNYALVTVDGFSSSWRRATPSMSFPCQMRARGPIRPRHASRHAVRLSLVRRMAQNRAAGRVT